MFFCHTFQLAEGRTVLSHVHLLFNTHRAERKRKSANTHAHTTREEERRRGRKGRKERKGSQFTRLEDLRKKRETEPFSLWQGYISTDKKREDTTTLHTQLAPASHLMLLSNSPSHHHYHTNKPTHTHTHTYTHIHIYTHTHTHKYIPQTSFPLRERCVIE
jgi:hypothetical protein